VSKAGSPLHSSTGGRRSAAAIANSSIINRPRPGQ
jgi:hypothetical protein